MLLYSKSHGSGSFEFKFFDEVWMMYAIEFVYIHFLYIFI
jgi:hypothetical protein